MSVDVGHPVAHRLVDRVLQRAAAGVDAAAPRRRAAACGRRSAPGAPCPRRPCRRGTRGRAARRPSPSRRRAGRRRSRRRCAACPCGAASSAWPSALLILCAPVCVRSSRFRKIRAPPAAAASRARLVERRRPPDVVRQQVDRARRGTPGPRAPRSTRARAPRPARPASRARSGRRTRRSSRARRDRVAEREPFGRCSGSHASTPASASNSARSFRDP